MSIAVPATEVKVRRRVLPADWRSQAAMAVALVLGAALMLAPFLWMIATSLSRKANSSMPRVPSFWPPDPSFFNYFVASQNLPIGRLYLNSLLVVGENDLLLGIVTSRDLLFAENPRAPVAAVMTGREPLVTLRYFGPHTNPDAPNVGDHSFPLPLDIGTGHDATNETDPLIANALSQLDFPDVPVYEISGCPNPFAPNEPESFYTSDPGKALVTGQCSDFNRVKGPILRGLAARAPYFHNGAAADLREFGRFDDAEKLLRQVLDIDPHHNHALISLGQIAQRRGDSAAALQAFEEALAIRPEFPEAAYNLGNAFREVGRLADAMRAWQWALQLRPDYPEALTNRGRARQALGDAAGAVVEPAHAVGVAEARPQRGLAGDEG